MNFLERATNNRNYTFEPQIALEMAPGFGGTQRWEPPKAATPAKSTPTNTSATPTFGATQRWEPPKASTPAKPTPTRAFGSSGFGGVQRWEPPEVSTPANPAPTQAARSHAKESPKPTASAQASSHSGTHSIDTEVPGKSLKKPKKRKRDPEAQAEVAQEDDGTTPKKHKAVLSKFEKASRKAKQAQPEPENEPEEKPEVILRDLQPLPQPAPVPEPVFKPTFSVLPTWLAQPSTVETSKRVPFEELGVEASFVKKLKKHGYNDALAVQSALLPMLQLGDKQHQGDICVSARTGSGKTLAYMLPIVEALKDRTTHELSAIIVVPTRQLVDQALQTAQELCAGTKISVGTAVGSVPLATEQKRLVERRMQFDPRGAAVPREESMLQNETGFVHNRTPLNDLAELPTHHTYQYNSTVDILICTPGRLVEHIGSTVGFALHSVKWLVIDEADQLLNQNFQGWCRVLMDALHGETPEDMMSAQDQLRRKSQLTGGGLIPPCPSTSSITKVILSATMEKDLTKLGALKLRRPKLVSVQDELEQQLTATDGDGFDLPPTLDEFAVPVGDGKKKPLYLLYLLLTNIFSSSSESAHKEKIDASDPSDASESDSDSDSDSDSSSDSDSDSSSDSDSDSSSDSGSSRGSETIAEPSIAKHKNRVLIFTKSNESASRLSHLLSVLEPSFKEYLRAMAPSSTAKASKKLLRAFSSGSVKILIASDAASRGLDIPDISHVINYDIPPSHTSYVHRVGRTARAGKAGEAWTLVTKTEAGWFWNQLAKGDNVRRGEKKIKRVEWKERSVEYNRRRTYEAALVELQGAVEGNDG